MILLRLAFQTVFLALSQIFSNKIRSMLTTLGVIIGVASVISVIAALDGLQNNILGEFEKFGAKRVFIDGRRPESMRNKITWREVQLKEIEVTEILKHSESLDLIVPMWYGGYSIAHGKRTIDSVSVIGMWPSWHKIENRQILQGRQFSAIDEDEKRQVCLINEHAIQELDLDRNPVGSYILVSGRRFLIVGVVETIQMSAMFGGGDTSTEVFIPFSTARKLNPNGWLNYAQGELKDPNAAEDAIAEIRFVLRKMRGLEPDEEDTFQIQVMQRFIDQFNSMAGAIKAGAGGIVAISLLVGGIGIMNIMLVSVSERTREIGLRKAVGARPMIILTQFLVEAVVLCLVGAGIGLLIGEGFVLGLRLMPDSPLSKASVPFWAIVLSVGFSAATGIIFGMFPAIKAARLNPIDALRHE